MKIGSDTPAIVTGGASGLGEATARRLAAAGAKVAIFDMNKELGEKVASEIGGVFCDVNVAETASVDAGLAKARQAHGQERITVICAGIGTPGKTVSKGEPMDPAAYEKVIKVNLFGTFLSASRSAAGMTQAEPVNADGERGVIIMTASVAAYEGQVGQVAYSASKGGVVGMVVPMARDLSRDGVRAMVIAPGLFLTPLLKSLPDDVQASLGAQVPFPSRLGDPSEYAQLAQSIVENPMMNGTVIRLDGAIRMAPR